MKVAVIAVAFLLTFPAAVPFVFAGEQHAIITTKAADGSKGSYSRIEERKSGPFRFGDHNMMDADAEVRAAVHRHFYFILEGGAKDEITRFDIQRPGEAVQVYSARAAGEPAGIRPWAMAPVDADKAYLLRKGTPVIWIVDPLAESNAAFRVGTIDLGPSLQNQTIDVCCGVVVDDVAFVALNVTDPGSVLQGSYIIAVDTAGDAVIDAGVEAGIAAVPLELYNVNTIDYLAATGKIYVQASGVTSPEPDFTGGILAFDPSSYETEIIIDDGDAGSEHGYTTGMAIVSAADAFMIAAQSDNSHKLYHFNPATGAINLVRHTQGPDYLSNKQLAGISGGIGLDRHKRLWISNITDRRIEIISTVPNDAGLYRPDGSINTIPNDSRGVAMAPAQIMFVRAPSETEEDEKRRPSSSGDSGNFCFINALR